MAPPYGRVGKIISKFKNLCIFPESDKFNEKKFSTFEIAVFRHVYKPYQDLLKSKNAVDFGDLLQHVIEILKYYPDVQEAYQNKFRYILVDEVQDLNPNQQEWLRLMVGENHNKLSCVGDDDQMIYSFMGAQGDLILNFEKYYKGAEIIRLEQNYRSTKRILESANNLISHNH